MWTIQFTHRSQIPCVLLNWKALSLSSHPLSGVLSFCSACHFILSGMQVVPAWQVTCQCSCLPGTLLWEQRSLSLLFAGTFLYRQWVTPSSSGTGFMTCLFLFRALYRNGMVARSVIVPFSPSPLFVITSGSYDGWSLISQLMRGCLEQH